MRENAEHIMAAAGLLCMTLAGFLTSPALGFATLGAGLWYIGVLHNLVVFWLASRSKD